MEMIVARWQDWARKGLEHLVLKMSADEIVAESIVIGNADGDDFAAQYRIVCDRKWCVNRIEVFEVGSNFNIELTSDGAGNWKDASGKAQPKLKGAIDVDISITPFTNTLPVRRLNLKRGDAAEIVTVYIRVPGLSVTTDRQRYTCL